MVNITHQIELLSILNLHQMCGVPQKHGGTHQQDQTPETGPMGGQPGGQDERGEVKFGKAHCKKLRIKAEDLQIVIQCQVGNINAKLKYEQWVPPSYRKVDSSTPQVIPPL